LRPPRYTVAFDLCEGGAGQQTGLALHGFVARTASAGRSRKGCKTALGLRAKDDPLLVTQMFRFVPHRRIEPDVIGLIDVARPQLDGFAGPHARSWRRPVRPKEEGS
jgi:hypothetical protein